jgi:hypothetical protein
MGRAAADSCFNGDDAPFPDSRTAQLTTTRKRRIKFVKSIDFK